MSRMRYDERSGLYVGLPQMHDAGWRTPTRPDEGPSSRATSEAGREPMGETTVQLSSGSVAVPQKGKQ